MSIIGNNIKYVWTDATLPQVPKEELRLRDTGDGVWAIVRVKPGAKFGTEVIAGGLTLEAASQMIELAKEE
jgi:hypothetical protein